jgi:hypothetical protein
MIYAKDTYTLKSGRILHARGGILGLAPPRGGNGSGDDLALYDGYDGVRYYEDGLGYDESRRYTLTQDERYEIASEMIHRWLRWAEG